MEVLSAGDFKFRGSGMVPTAEGVGLQLETSSDTSTLHPRDHCRDSMLGASSPKVGTEKVRNKEMLPDESASKTNALKEMSSIGGNSKQHLPINTFDKINLNGLSERELLTFGCAHTYGANRSLFRSREGHFGLGPDEIVPGDVITALLGCNSTMILRPTQDGKYKVVGEALCQGFFDGEGFLGPLPDSVKPVLYYDETCGESWWAFRNQKTEQFLLGDPRLGELPAGWKKEEYDDERRFFSWFVNERTGQRLTDADPRMTPEALKERGVDLKVFELI